MSARSDSGIDPAIDSPVIEQQLRHRSVRRFLDTPVTDAQLDRIVGAAQRASTSSNLQAWTVIAIRDADRKRRISQAIGDYDALKRSRSSQPRSSSTTSSYQRERIFDVADLTAMPFARAVLLATQTPPALIKLEHFSTKAYAAKVKESQAYYESRVVDSAAKQGEHA